MESKKVILIIFLIIILGYVFMNFFGSQLDNKNSISENNTERNNKSSISENNTERNNKSTFDLGDEPGVTEYSNVRNEEIYHYYSRPDSRSIVIDEAFPKLQVLVEYNDLDNEAIKRTILYKPSGVQASSNENNIEIEKEGDGSFQYIEYTVYDPTPGRWRVKTQDSTYISITAQSFSDYHIDLPSLNITYKKGENIRVIPDIYLSKRTDAEIAGGKFLLTKAKWSDDGNSLLFDKAYLFDLNKSKKRINGEIIIDSDFLEKGFYNYEYIVTLDNGVKIRSTSSGYIQVK